MISSVKIFARIGELIQGILPDGNEFLVSGLSSGTLYSEATLEEAGATPQAGGKAVGKAVDLPPKAAKALSLFAERHGRRLPQAASLPIRLRSNIPPGKGLSSSSTDILSVLSLVNGYPGAGLDSEELYRLAAQVEPTDPCLSTEIMLFRQRSGTTMAKIPLPPLSLLFFDAAPDRQVDTLLVERQYPADAGDFFDGLLRQFLRSAAELDYPGLLDCITRSATYNQAILPLPGYAAYYQLAIEIQAGLMVAHSGTIAGWLVRPEEEGRLRERLERIVAPGLIYSEHYLPAIHRAYA